VKVGKGQARKALALFVWAGDWEDKESVVVQLNSAFAAKECCFVFCNHDIVMFERFNYLMLEIRGGKEKRSPDKPRNGGVDAEN